MRRETRKTCYIRTFGCQMNEHDSQKMSLLLKLKGYFSTDEPQNADLILINTCTIREKAYHKAESEIGRFKIIKQKRPETIIAVCGCVAQQEGESLCERYEHVDIVFGPDQIGELPNLIDRLEQSKRVTALRLINDIRDYRFVSDVPGSVLSGHSFVTISKGCNCSCSYCIVPSVRGREISRAQDEVIDEVKRLVRAGVKEVTLLGQNVTSYNSPVANFEKGSKAGLAELINRIANETDIMRIRFTSPNPKDVGKRLIEEFAHNQKLCSHIHLPIQSGNNEILKKMKRGYTREKYLEIVDLLRKARPNISITSDFIVGFPGEGEPEYKDTVDLLTIVKFDSIFAFKYSQRPETKAALEFEDDVPQDVKETRLECMLNIQREITRQKNESLVGQVFDLLITGLDRKGTGRLMGRLSDNRIVHFTGNKRSIGSIVRILITRALANSLEGEILR